jgi:hypothetical protein
VTTEVAGYRVYVGRSSGAYTSTYDVGNVTSFRLTSAQPGITYYFAVAAYASGGSVGTLSREVSGAASGSSAEPTPPSPSTGSGSSVLTVGADAYVRGGEFASSNYGAASVLEAKHTGGSSQEYDRQIYLRFDLAGMVAPVASVSLRMYVEGLPNGTPANVCAYQVSIDSWSEGTLVWNNRPEAGGTIGCRSVSASGWVSFDVSAYVVQQLGSDRIASFVLADTTGGNRMVRFASRESGANAPVLQVD